MTIKQFSDNFLLEFQNSHLSNTAIFPAIFKPSSKPNKNNGNKQMDWHARREIPLRWGFCLLHAPKAARVCWPCGCAHTGSRDTGQMRGGCGRGRRLWSHQKTLWSSPEVWFTFLKFYFIFRGFEHTMKTITGLDYEVLHDNFYFIKIENFQTKLSSAGLIYAHYGREVIRQILEKQKEPKQKDGPTQADLDKLYDRLYKNFVESIDAIDNGIQQFEGPSRFGEL